MARSKYSSGLPGAPEIMAPKDKLLLCARALPSARREDAQDEAVSGPRPRGDRDGAAETLFAPHALASVHLFTGTAERTTLRDHPEL